MLLIIAIVLAALFLYFYSLPKHAQVQRSIQIDRPAGDIFRYVRDSRNWPAWSPWLIHDAQTQLTYQRPGDLGGGYSWVSDKIGSGSLTLLTQHENRALDYRLQFLRPFKSRADTDFAFAEHNGSTQVTWRMKNALPWFMRPMRAMFERMIGFDFALGLAQMRGQLDPRAERPQLAFDGIQTLPAQTCVALPFTGNLPAMQSAMRANFNQLNDTVALDRRTGSPLAVYRKIKCAGDEKRMHVVMHMALPVASVQGAEKALQVAGGAYFQTTLKGGYQFLGSAWNSASGHMRMEKLKEDKSRPALEIYQHHPATAANTNDLVTLICIPVKS